MRPSEMLLLPLYKSNGKTKMLGVFENFPYTIHLHITVDSLKISIVKR